MTVCATAQEPLLFVGPPGTAKSDLVVKWVESVGLNEGDYFEYMLTKFTEPSTPEVLNVPWLPVAVFTAVTWPVAGSRTMRAHAAGSPSL